MNRFKAKLLMLLLATFSLGVIIGVTGFAFQRGYMMRFIVDGVELSRDEFFALAYSTSDEVSLHCVQPEFSLSEGIVAHCFDTQEEVTAFMDR
jgi:hypothetical protein